MLEFGIIIGVVGYVVLIILIDTKFFWKRKNHNRSLRAIYYATVFLLPAFLFVVVGKFIGVIETWKGFFWAIVFILVVSVFSGFAQYYSLVYNDWRVRRLRNKISEMPDGPKKVGLKKLLDIAETPDSKNQSQNSSL